MSGKVYVVEYCDAIDHEDCCGVFLSNAKANDYIAKRVEPGSYNIVTVTVDLEIDPMCECFS